MPAIVKHSYRENINILKCLTAENRNDIMVEFKGFGDDAET